jgi:thioredoxin 1
MSEATVPVISAQTFTTQVEQEGQLTLVDFYADWCAPCKMLAPVLDDLAEEFEGKINIVKINADAEPDVLAKYAVRGLPTMMVFKEGKSVDVAVGAQSYSTVKKFIENSL